MMTKALRAVAIVGALMLASSAGAFAQQSRDGRGGERSPDHKTPVEIIQRPKSDSSEPAPRNDSERRGGEGNDHSGRTNRSGEGKRPNAEEG